MSKSQKKKRELTLSIIVKNIEQSVEENKHSEHPEQISLIDSDFVQQMTQSYIVQGSRQYTGFKLESLVLWNDRIYSMNEFNQKKKLMLGLLNKMRYTFHHSVSSGH